MTVSALLPLRASVPATTMEVGPLIQHLVGWMIKLLTGRSRHEADPFHSICWMPFEMWPEGSNAIAVTEPISARRRVSDLAEFVYKRTNFAGMAPGLRCPEIVSSTSRRAYRRGKRAPFP